MSVELKTFVMSLGQALCMFSLIGWALARVWAHLYDQHDGKVVPVNHCGELVGWWVWIYDRRVPEGSTGQWSWKPRSSFFGRAKPPSPPPIYMWLKKPDGIEEIVQCTERRLAKYVQPPDPRVYS